MPAAAHDRTHLVRRGRHLEVFTVAYNSLEAVLALVSGVLSGSIALLGFGFDSLIEVTSGATLLWRLRHDADPNRRRRAESTALRVVGVCFLALAVYVAWEAIESLFAGHAPNRSVPGILIAAVSVVVMPVLARAKRRVAHRLNSAALEADARQTDFCLYLSVILLAGLGLNAALGWWWADPLAALVMVPIIGREGWTAVHGRSCCGCGSGAATCEPR